MSRSEMDKELIIIHDISLDGHRYKSVLFHFGTNISMTNT